MATITVKNLPDELYEKIKESAKMNRRSINSEIIVCVERAFQRRTTNTGKILNKSRALREKTAHFPLTDKEIAEAKNAGRL